MLRSKDITFIFALVRVYYYALSNRILEIDDNLWPKLVFYFYKI